MAVADPLVMPLANALVECLAQELAKVARPPANVGLRTGTVVDHLISTTEDECCAGLGWVRPAGIFPTNSLTSPFPAQDTDPAKTGPKNYAITLEMGAIRCAPTPGPSAIPSQAEWDETTNAVMDDAAAMRRAVCCLVESYEIRWTRIVMGLWQPLSVQGGCVGGIQPVTILGPACDCPDAGPES